MMLKTSSRKINPFFNMIGFTLRKSLGITVILCIAALLYCPGSYIVNFEEMYNSYGTGLYSMDLIHYFAIVVTILSAAVAVLFNIINLSFMCKKSSSDVFHALPLTRCELLISRVISSLISTFIPVFVCYISFGIMAAFNTWMGSISQLAYYLLYTVIITLVCSSFSLVFIISAGSAFDLGVSLIGANLALLVIGWIFESILYELLIGYNGHTTSVIMYNLSPPYFCAVGFSTAYDFNKYGVKGSGIEFFVRSAIYIAVFTVASILLYNRRKAEKGGSAYAYRFMYLICSLLAGICGGFLVGMIFNNNISSFAFWFFTIIGCILTAIIFGAVTNRGFKGVWHSGLMGILSAVVLISVALSGITGGFGYTKRIPEKSKIKSVSVSAFAENITIDNVDQAIALHKAILNTNSTEFDDDLLYNYRRTVNFYYELENGKTLSREFTIESLKVANELMAIYKGEDRLNMINSHIDIENINSPRLYFYYNSEYYDASITKAEAEEFIKVYWLDVQNCDESILITDSHTLELSGHSIEKDENYYRYFHLDYFDNFTNTKQFIEEHNLVERSKQEGTEVK